MSPFPQQVSIVIVFTANEMSPEEFFVYADGEGRQFRSVAYIFPHGFYQSLRYLSDVGTLRGVVPGVLFSSHLPSLRMRVLLWLIRFS